MMPLLGHVTLSNMKMVIGSSWLTIHIDNMLHGVM
jgi:hypothetical protein